MKSEGLKDLSRGVTTSSPLLKQQRINKRCIFARTVHDATRSRAGYRRVCKGGTWRQSTSFHSCPSTCAWFHAKTGFQTMRNSKPFQTTPARPCSTFCLTATLLSTGEAQQHLLKLETFANPTLARGTIKRHSHSRSSPLSQQRSAQPAKHTVCTEMHHQDSLHRPPSVPRAHPGGLCYEHTLETDHGRLCSSFT